MSILSNLPDGCGYYYGFRGEDYRQINVRYEGYGRWHAYVGGKQVRSALTKEDAEELALKWMDENPLKDEGE